MRSQIGRARRRAVRPGLCPRLSGRRPIPLTSFSLSRATACAAGPAISPSGPRRRASGRNGSPAPEGARHPLEPLAFVGWNSIHPAQPVLLRRGPRYSRPSLIYENGGAPSGSFLQDYRAECCRLTSRRSVGLRVPAYASRPAIVATRWSLHLRNSTAAFALRSESPIGGNPRR